MLRQPHLPGLERHGSIFRGSCSAVVVEYLMALHLQDVRTVVDLTYGDGVLWNWEHPHLAITGLDIDADKAAEHDVHWMDGRRTTFPDASFDMAMVDPPFMHGVKKGRAGRGHYTGAMPSMNRDYSHLETQKQVIQLYRDLINEARRLVRVGIIVKCKDTIEHGGFVEVSRHVSEALDFYDFRVVDKGLYEPMNELVTDEDDAVRHLRRRESYFYAARVRRRRG
jgi:hypothetical protein